jgi:thiol-disulfide isomerase/thioredoxin
MPQRTTLAAIALVLLVAACSGPVAPTAVERPTLGRWALELDLNGHILPVHLEVVAMDSASWIMQVMNGAEVITIKDIERRGDSLFVRMPLYDSEFKAVLHNADHMSGVWHNYLRGPEYTIPFVAKAGAPPPTEGPSNALIGQWRVHFSPGKPDGYDAIGLFEQHAGGRATGTFLTETGDYRYLEGHVQGDSLLLGGFDGSHAFLFKAGIHGDSLNGRFMSGTHFEEPWIGVRDETFALRDPDSLTFLREGHEMVEFSFPDLDGNPVSPADERFRGKALLVQVMGSWCANCVDETRLLNELYAKHHDDGLEVIAVAFEKHDDTARAMAGLERFRNTLEVHYPILYAGKASKEEASAKMPFLDHVMSFPTCIMVDRSGKVRRIRTGIYGPSTGAHYAHYKRSLSTYVEELLQEQPQAMSQR